MNKLIVICILLGNVYGEFPCDENAFKCKFNQHFCIPYHWVCDGTPDCHDASDEIFCPSTLTTPKTTKSFESEIEDLVFAELDLGSTSTTEYDF